MEKSVRERMKETTEGVAKVSRNDGRSQEGNSKSVSVGGLGWGGMAMSRRMVKKVKSNETKRGEGRKKRSRDGPIIKRPPSPVSRQNKSDTRIVERKINPRRGWGGGGGEKMLGGKSEVHSQGGEKGDMDQTEVMGKIEGSQRHNARRSQQSSKLERNYWGE